MISLLTQIVNQLVCWIETAAIAVCNAVIVALAALITATVAALPSFPSISMPTALGQSIAWGEYWFPVDWFFTELTVFLTLWFLWLVFAIALRWARAIRGNQ